MRNTPGGALQARAVQGKQWSKGRWRRRAEVLVKGRERNYISGDLKMGTVARCQRPYSQTVVYFPLSGNSSFPRGMLVAAPKAPPCPVRGHWGALAEPPSACGAAGAAHLLPGKAFHPLPLYPASTGLGCRHLRECLLFI